MSDWFVSNLLDWGGRVVRPLAWRGERDAYRILLSEILLQQTRAEQGEPYYLRFVAAFPTVADLAEAAQDDILKLWEGLGYYARARNLHKAAKQIMERHGGQLPADYAALRALSGVGDYTASAIASFAFDLPYAVVDGNVYRVLSRFFGIETPIDTTKGKKEFAELAQRLLPAAKAAAYNQAIMDFGATLCRPARPLCAECPLRRDCRAWELGRVEALPQKSKKIAKKQRYFYYFVFEYAGQVYLRQRADKDVWQGLYDFPSVELSDRVEVEDLLRQFPLPAGAALQGVRGSFSQQLTHQKISALFLEVRLSAPLPQGEDWAGAFALPRGEAEGRYPFPKLVVDYWRAGKSEK